MIPLLLALCGPAEAGAWTRAWGELYVKGGVDVYKALRFVLPGTSTPVDGSYFGQQASLYGEAGLSKGHPVQLGLSLPVVNGDARTTATDALGDIEVHTGVTRMGDLRLLPQIALSRKHPISLAVEAKIPLYANGKIGNSAYTWQELFPRPGDGQVDLTAWLAAGGSAWEGGFFELSAGYRWRTEAFVGWSTSARFVDGVPAIAKVGHRLGPALLLVDVDVLVNVAQSDITRQWLRTGFGALIDLGDKGVAVELRAAGEPWARAASQGIGGGVGLSYRKPR